MRLYRAYGLVLACERALPLAAANGAAAADVAIAVALGQAATDPVASPQRELRRDGASWSLHYRNPAGGWLDYEYAAAAGTLTVAGSVAWESAIPPLLGVVCAVLLSSAGRPLLHGAAVAFGEGAIGVLGDSGLGKSTFAAALVKAGGRLLSEDLLAFTRNGEAFDVEPGYARISLLPDAREGLGFRAGASAALQRRSGTTKSWIAAAAASEAAAVRRLYILAPGHPAAPDGRIERLSRSAAAPALARQLYGSAWIRPVSRSDLAFCGSLAAQVPVFTLARPATVSRVEACAAMLRAAASSGKCA